MISSIFLFSFIVSFLFMVLIFYFIRKRALREQYALLWIMLSALMILLSTFPAILDKIAGIMNVTYPPSLLYFLGSIGILLILLHITVVVSKLTERTIKLAQMIALQKQQMDQLGNGELSHNGKKVVE